MICLNEFKAPATNTRTDSLGLNLTDGLRAGLEAVKQLAARVRINDAF